jgi:hypothetical protein
VCVCVCVCVYLLFSRILLSIGTVIQQLYWGPDFKATLNIDFYMIIVLWHQIFENVLRKCLVSFVVEPRLSGLHMDTMPLTYCLLSFFFIFCD